METIEPLPSGNPLQRLPELTEEVFFAFHLQINKMLYLNEAFERIWNVSRESIGSNLTLLFETVHPDDRAHVTSSFFNLKEDKQKQTIEFRILQPHGGIKWLKVDAYLSDKSDNKIVVGTGSDITGYKDYIETLHKFSNKKNSILQILSHDLLGPLGNIQMSALMLSKYPEIAEKADIMELIDLVGKNSKRSVTMIRDLINREFLESSETTLVKQRVDIVLKIQEIIEQYKDPNAVARQTVDFETPLNSLYVSIDVSKFIQVINNLLLNAQKFTPDGGHIVVSLEDKQKTIVIKVQDNGIGIPEEMKPFIFDKFTKARRMGIKGEPTTGLGMSIIKTIVEWHDGRIWFESTEGKGTTFYVEIPK